MKIPPPYEITSEIQELIIKIDALRLFFLSFPLSTQLKQNIQRVSLLKSSLFSARIEGNPLTMENIDFTTDKEKKMEVLNIELAAKYIEKNINNTNKLTKQIILKIHSVLMHSLRSDAGFFRKESSAIFNQAGVAVYVAPPPLYMSELLNKLIEYIDDQSEKFPLIKAFIAHLVFEKIHPFIDGNGRVGRLLIYAICKSLNYDFGFFVAFEEYLDQHKSDYYHYLDIGLKETEEYLIFMLEAYLNQVEKMKEHIIIEQGKKILLPPRQEEIYQIIKDHPMISFDFIRRRFLKVPERTLRYDLKKLIDQNLIVKIGKTKGSYYKVI
ncbi:Fic family protein [Candidatus Roizmanbacteria bacterium]|nr:Fic family protein [Candidatus Roizmanbacteria bacterium]